MTSYYWDVTSGNFGAATSWFPQGTPTSSDTTNIDMSTSLFGSGSAEYLDIFDDITVTISASLATAIADYVSIGSGTGVTTVDVDAAWTNTSAINVGNGPGDDGVVNVNAGGSLTTGSLTINAGGEVFAKSGGTIDAQNGVLLYGDALLQVDSSSTFEDSDADGAALGYLTVGPLASGAALDGDGTIDADLVDDGKVFASDGTLTINGPTGATGTITGTGQLHVGGQATLVVNASVASSVTARFEGWDGTLALADPAGFSAPIENFNAGDTIDIQGLTYDRTPSSYKFTPTGAYGAGTLVVTEGSVQRDARHRLLAADDLGRSHAQQDTSGNGTDVTFTNGAAQSPFNLWSSLGSFFNTTSGTVNGEDYGLSTSHRRRHADLDGDGDAGPRATYPAPPTITRSCLRRRTGSATSSRRSRSPPTTISSTPSSTTI